MSSLQFSNIPAPRFSAPSEFPRFAYHQKDKDIPARVVNSKDEAIALGEDWGPFPWTDKKIDRTPVPDIPGIAIPEEPQGDEYPKFVYHQRAANVPAKRVEDPDEEAKLGSDWGPLPFTEAKLAALEAKEKAEAEAKGAADAKATADAKAAAADKAAADAKAAADKAAADKAAADAKATADAKNGKK